jgi:hypothetical protein
MPAHAPVWYAVAQGALCLSVAWAVLALYWRGPPVQQGEPAPTPARDAGLLWLGLAIAIWGIIGVLLLLHLPDSPEQALRTVLSSANSGCLLISASHLDYGPPWLQRASDYRRWNQLALIGSLAVALVTIALYAAFGSAAHAARLPDFLLSSVTLLLYGFGLFRSFRRRGFGPLAVLAVLAIGLQFVAQLPEIIDEAALHLAGERRWILTLVSKAMVMVAFLSLAVSWVYEWALRPPHSAIRLRFTGRRVVARKIGRRPSVRFIVKLGDGEFEMHETPHRDLLFLAVARVRDAGHDGAGWVSLHDLVGRHDDTRIYRIRQDLQPVGLAKEIEASGQKSYRLAIEPEHIQFDCKTLAQEPALEAITKNIPATAA